MQIQTVY